VRHLNLPDDHRADVEQRILRPVRQHADQTDRAVLPDARPDDEGTKVRFSADFVTDDGSCVKGTNITETFYGSDPDFLVRYADVAAQ
jgi:hypothetical protein